MTKAYKYFSSNNLTNTIIIYYKFFSIYKGDAMKKHSTILTIFAAVLLGIFLLNIQVQAQGVTTSAMSGTVMDTNDDPLPGANIIAVHVPSGSQYGAATRLDGRFVIQGMRVGGPYTVTASYIGFQNQVQENIFISLGVAANLQFVLSDQEVEIGEVTITAQRDAIFSNDRTGAATTVSFENIQALPTISGRIEDFTRLTPQANASSFAGQDNRLNNITVDGSYFNNSFGLAGQPGDRTNVAPISLEAIEELQVSIAPYDVRQGNFVGAGVNTVTRSGTNEFSGSVYYMFRNEAQVGSRAGENTFNPGTFTYDNIGVRLGGPIVKNKLFFFGSFESDQLIQPGTTYLANTGNQTVGGNITRVRASTMDSLSNFLQSNFGYETGPYQGYDHETPALRFLLRFDYNLDDKNKLSLRYTHLDSETVVLASNSSSLGFGQRRTNLTGLNFQNSNYIILENIRSIVGEWNTNIGNNMSNNLIIGYNYSDESRDSRGTMFPFVDVLDGGSVYTSFGFEPFTPSNELRYNSFQLQNNFTLFLTDHYLTFGASLERYESENVFFPGSQSAYTYNSLEDFYADANGYLSDPNRTIATNPATGDTITLRRFQVRWSNQPGLDKPLQPLKLLYGGIYAQDEWQILKNLRLTIGVRADAPMFEETGFKNAQVDTLFFRDEDGQTVQYKTDKLPDVNILFSPRLGFNWDVFENQTTQVRGGSGIFTGRPAYVWISNQIGENGVLTGFQQIDNTSIRPFNPDVNHYKQPATGEPPSSYGLAFTDPEFKFPQIWRSNFAVDQRLPFGFIGTAEFLYNKDVNGIYYINANLTEPSTNFAGVDNRPRWTAGNRVNSNITSAIVLKNQSEGYSYNIALSLEKPFNNNWYTKLGWSYGESKNTVDPGSIAFGSWNNNQHSGDPNNPGASFSTSTLGHRVFAALSYRFGSVDYSGGMFGATTVSLFWEGGHAFGIDPFNFFQRTTSYTFSGDLNGDGGTSNDLIYIHNDQSEMNFQEYATGGVTYTAAMQAAAWDAFIQQDEYLSKNRGKYAERNGIRLPMVFRGDFSISQDVYFNVLNKRQTLQFRVTVLNVGNLLNKEWGVADRLVSNQPLIVPTTAQGGPADANGAAQYRLRVVNGELINKSTEKSVTIFDVYRMQFGVRYMFN